MPRDPRDDRDHPCSLAGLTNRQLAWRALGVRLLTGDELIKDEQRATMPTETAIALLSGVVGWIVWVLVGIPLTGTKNTWAGHLVIPFFFCIVVSSLAWFFSLGWVRSLKFDRIAQIHLEHGRCPACGYVLADLPLAGDGCVVCPECNAAWRGQRVGSAETG